MKECDVLIIGAGLTGGMLARQLKLRHPELRIIVIDRKTSFDYWVGESTTETWEDYAVRVLKLGPYLSTHHIQKHGLRFFFDSEQKNLTLTEMSEYGRSFYHPFTARQLDRSQMDADLCKMNQEMGIEVLLGTRVLGRQGDSMAQFIRLDGERGHEVDTTAGTIRCRWLADAAGRSSPLAQLLDLEEPDPGHRAGAYWARFRNCNNIDALGPEEWGDRIKHTERFNSTNHFMYRGSWIWCIPVNENMISLGVTFQHDHAPMSFKNAGELETFLRSHRAVNEIMGDKAEAADFGGLKYLARLTKQSFSEDRWGLVGMSACFLDPVSSNQCTLLSEHNRWFGELVASDLAGDRELLKRQVKHFNIQVRARYHGLRYVYGDSYDLYGSYDTWVPLQGSRISSFFNRDVNEHFTSHKLFLDTIREHDHDCGCSIEHALDKHEAYRGGVIRLAHEMRDFLDKRGLYWANNRGQWEDMCNWEIRPSIQGKFRKPIDLRVEAAVELETWEIVFKRMVRRMAEIENIPFDEDRFRRVFKPDPSSRQTLSDALRAMSQPS